ncbi:Actin cross-linking toxin VgrG1 [Saezia sanguinis]|uniref:Actin cross-linking toxin VgrG1 n=1 Tax=Saezia sanguinis TaxID=1965230 RepID=A0A433SFC9_9BURK|nr:type VI secretion system Vgr family protein [Saezia sanguinis]RUS67396.1 Actin cross-linking toxin VgrG1 [Saezia sanguinis]
MVQTDLRFSFEAGKNNEESETTPITFDVVEFKLEEALNEPFVLEIELLSSDANINFDKLLDQPALFTIWQGGTAVRYVRGLISNFSQRETGFRRTRYHAVVEPMLSRTRLYSDWEIFQQQSVPEIVGKVLKADRVDNYILNAQQPHLSREFCVQADETDLQFIQRLLAEESFVYRFEHGEQNHQLLITDVIQTFGSLSSTEDTEGQEDNAPAAQPVLYQPNPAGDRPQPALRTFAYQEKVRTARQTQRDYTFKNPRYDQQQMSIGRHMPAQSTEYERYDYPGRYKQDSVGVPFTRTRLQSLRRDARTATASGDDARIQPGVAFELTGHPRGDLNTFWRPVRVEHKGQQHTSGEEEAASAQVSTHYEQTAELVPATTEWKAEIPPKPHLHGPEIAHVVGPVGEEIFTDEYGRVKVQFPWDRIGGFDEHSTCWIRVAQNWAGAGWGHMALPRVGQEVIVDFLDGDPDQPIITGRTYDANHPTPYRLPALKTQQTVKSKEHKGTGYNELLIDDTTGEIKTQLHSTHGATQLTLGYLTHPRRNDGTGDGRGEGFELRTDDWGAIRAAKGLYISTDERQNAQGKQLDLQEAIDNLQNALGIAQQLAQAAQTAKAIPAEVQDQRQQLQEVYTDLKASGILSNSVAGTALASTRSAQVSANQHVTITSGKNTDVSAAKNLTATAADAVSIVAVQQGMQLIANQGMMQVQAQHGEMNIIADKTLKILSTHGKTEIAAQKELLLTCQGAYIKLSGGRIEIGGTKLDLKAPFNATGSATINYAMPMFTPAKAAFNLTGTPLEQHEQTLTRCRFFLFSE